MYDIMNIVKFFVNHCYGCGTKHFSMNAFTADDTAVNHNGIKAVLADSVDTFLANG